MGIVQPEIKCQEPARRQYHSEEEGEIIHRCKTCEASFKNQQNLMQHFESKHEGIRYECTDCEYKATTKSNLRRHQRKYHETELKKEMSQESGMLCIT